MYICVCASEFYLINWKQNLCENDEWSFSENELKRDNQSPHEYQQQI